MRTTNLTLSTSQSRRRTSRAARPGRSRILVVAEIVALVAIALSLIAGTIITSSGGTEVESTTRVFVEQGDTAWTLARQHPVPGLTTQQTADLIAKMNANSSEGIQVGTAVMVPAAPRDRSVVAYR